MAKHTDYKAIIETTIAGIPAQIGVWNYKVVKGQSMYTAQSDLDYYGYVEYEYDILDRKGYKAAWLEKKLNGDYSSIEEKIAEYYRD